MVTLKHTFAAKGRLRRDACRQLWKPPKYPPHLHSFLLRLLVRFELLFPLAKEKDSADESGGGGDRSIVDVREGEELVERVSSIAGEKEEKDMPDMYFVPFLLPSLSPPELLQWWCPFSSLLHQLLSSAGKEVSDLHVVFFCSRTPFNMCSRKILFL